MRFTLQNPGGRLGPQKQPLTRCGTAEPHLARKSEREERGGSEREQEAPAGAKQQKKTCAVDLSTA